MKVLHILNELRLSGAETMLCIVASSFSEKGVIAEVLSTGDQLGNYAPQLEQEGYKLHHLPFSKTPKFFYRLYRLIREHNYNVVHIHAEKANVWIGLVALAAGPKRVLRTVHNTFRFKGALRIRRMLQRKLLSLLGLVHVSIGPSVQKNELVTFGLETRHVSNWYNDTHFEPANETACEQARIALKLPLANAVLVTVGNCSRVKNHAALLHALAMLPEARRPMIYLHVGNECADQLERKLAVELGISDCVRFLGPLTDIRQVLMAADFFVMPSLYEGFGIAAIEALGMGLPAIFTDVPGLCDFRAEFDSLYYAKPDALSLHKVLSVLLAEKVQVRRSRSKGYPDICKDRYSVENGVAGYFSIYSGN